MTSVFIALFSCADVVHHVTDYFSIKLIESNRCCGDVCWYDLIYALDFFVYVLRKDDPFDNRRQFVRFINCTVRGSRYESGGCRFTQTNVAIARSNSWHLYDISNRTNQLIGSAAAFVAKRTEHLCVARPIIIDRHLFWCNRTASKTDLKFRKPCSDELPTRWEQYRSKADFSLQSKTQNMDRSSKCAPLFGIVGSVDKMTNTVYGGR